jgi:outer membrane lipoprotein SlyB
MKRSLELGMFALCAVIAACFGVPASAQAPPPLQPPLTLPPPILWSPATPPSTAATPAVGTAGCDRCGTVESIRQAVTKDQWTPLGSVPSSADVGNSSMTMYQIGKGFTNQGQVLVGAAGGTVYRTQPNQRNITRWEVSVRMDDGSTRTLTQNYEPLLQVSDRVRVFGTQIELVQ